MSNKNFKEIIKCKGCQKMVERHNGNQKYCYKCKPMKKKRD